MSPLPSILNRTDHAQDIVVDVKTDKVLAKKGHVFDTVMDANKWTETMERLRELQELRKLQNK
jgi:hypothetical protein